MTIENVVLVYFPICIGFWLSIDTLSYLIHKVIKLFKAITK